VADDARLRAVMAAYLVLGNPNRRADFDRVKGMVPASTAGIRIHRHTCQGAEPMVSAGPVFWHGPVCFVPDSRT
jgi:curved DNA-binding protein CbpA